MARRIGHKTAESYQDRIAEAVRRALIERRSGAVMAPTGSGKSLNVHTTVEDSFELGYPILVMHPNIELLRQNLGQLLESSKLTAARFSLFIAEGEKIENLPPVRRNHFDAHIILATTASFVRKRNDPEFIRNLEKFSKANGVILVDEGQTAAAEQLGALFERAANNGAIGYVLSATPFRANGKDPLKPFGADMESDLIEAADYDEVLKTGRIVKTVFDLAYKEFEDIVGADGLHALNAAFEEVMETTGSVDQASQESLARLFRPDLANQNADIATRIKMAVGEIWRRRAASHHLTLVHCDNVEFASQLADHVRKLKLPQGHAREGQAPTVGFITAYETVIYHKGHHLDLKLDLGWRQRDRRQKLLGLARAGKIDIIINVFALTAGVDIPRADCTILAAAERSLSPVKQMAGRGERSDPSVKKNRHTLVDIGRSITMIAHDIAMMQENTPERARKSIRRLNPRILTQFSQWFAHDPNLKAAASNQYYEIQARRAEPLHPEDVLPATAYAIPSATLPRFTPYAEGIELSFDAEINKLAVLVDLEKAGLAPHINETGAPGLLLTVIEPQTGATSGYLIDARDKALRFAAFSGLRNRTPKNSPAKNANVPRLAMTQPIQPWARNIQTPDDADQSQASAVLNQFGLKNLALALQNRIAKSIACEEANHPSKAISLDRLDTICPVRMALTLAYCRLSPQGHKTEVFCSDPEFTSDQATSRAFIEAGAKILPGSAFKDADEKARLAALSADNKILCVASRFNTNDWMLQRLGVIRSHDGARHRKRDLDATIAKLRDAFPSAPGKLVFLANSIEADEANKAIRFNARHAKTDIAYVISMLRHSFCPHDATTNSAAWSRLARAATGEELHRVELDEADVVETFSTMPSPRQAQLLLRLKGAVATTCARTTLKTTTKPKSVLISISATKNNTTPGKITRYG